MAQKGKVLYLDDDDILRRATCLFLSKVGFKVESARDGVDAVNRYARAWEAGAPFDVVILDLSIPGGMGGAETFSVIREFDPEVQAIVTSGYADDPFVREYTRHGFAGVMVKPYDVEDLGATVQKATRLRQQVRHAVAMAG